MGVLVSVRRSHVRNSLCACGEKLLQFFSLNENAGAMCMTCTACLPRMRLRAKLQLNTCSVPIDSHSWLTSPVVHKTLTEKRIQCSLQAET